VAPVRVRLQPQLGRPLRAVQVWPVIEVEGIRYVTATEAPDHLGADIVPAMIRDWKRRRLITGYRVGKVTYYRLDELIEVEYVLRDSGKGRRRRAT
jgi:hypothetical protein